MSAQWFGPGETVNVQGYVVPGMVYVGQPSRGFHDYDRRDNCVIRLDLKVSPAEPSASKADRYLLSFRDMTPRDRGSYLKWLETGRSAPDASEANVYLFFYGLERRLFDDGLRSTLPVAERDAIVQEVKRLTSLYGPRFGKPFTASTTRFQLAEWAIFRRDETVPLDQDWSVDFDEADQWCDYYSRDNALHICLAWYSARQKPVPSGVILRWLEAHPEVAYPSVAKRFADEFNSLFSERYRKRFKGGIVLPNNSRRLKVYYHPANPILHDVSRTVEQLNDPFYLTAPLRKVRELLSECAQALNPYARHTAQVQTRKESVTALALLPEELRGQKDIIITAREKLGALAQTEDFIDIGPIYQILGQGVPEEFKKLEAEKLAVILEKLGYHLVPDVRYYGTISGPDTKFLLHPHRSGKRARPSAAFGEVSLLLRLGSAVLAADETVTENQGFCILEKPVDENPRLDEVERSILKKYLRWCLVHRVNFLGLKKQLQSLAEEARTGVGQGLVTVIGSSVMLSPKQISQLQTVYTKLGLDKSSVLEDLHRARGASHVLLLGTTAPNQRVNRKRSGQTDGKMLSLNKELIRLRERETRKVRAVLETIFVDTIDEALSAPTAARSAKRLMAGLDNSHRAFFEKIVQKDCWERPALYEVAQSLGLMLDGAMEVLNEWAFDTVKAPLIEDGDPVYVDLELVGELNNAN